MKKVKTLFSVITSLAIIITMLPLSVYAKSNDGQIRIIVQNNTYSVSDGAKWDGTLIDEWVDIDSDSSILTAFAEAVKKKGLTQTGAEVGYITEIGGLSAYDGGNMSGWLATLNDWITDEGLSAYTVKSGKLENGDEICFQYSCDWGADIGYSWSGTNTKLKSLKVSEGRLSPAFEADTTEYDLEVSSDIKNVKIIPTAENKAFRTRIYKNSYSPENEIKRSSEISISDTNVIYIRVGSNNSSSEIADTIYKINFVALQPKPTNNDIAKAAETEKLISSIGTVTVKSKESITSARKSYNGLTSLQQSLVSNYDILLTAEKDYLKIEKTQIDFDEIFSKSTSEILSKNTSSLAVVGNEWKILGLARGEKITDEIRNKYIKSVEEYISSIGSSKLSKTKSTDNSKFIIVLTSLGYDVTNVNGINLIEPLADYDYVTAQGINGTIYALIALDTKNYETVKSNTAKNQTTREKLIDAIISAQLSDGGWTFYGTVSDADMTSIALQSLAPYYSTNNKVKVSVDKALAFLSENQRSDGTFVSYGSSDCESSAQVITALTSLGIDISTDTRFIKNGNTALDGLKLFYDNGNFSHLQNDSTNALSTDQAYYALVSYYRYSQVKTSLYDMSDVTISENTNSDTSSNPESSDKDSSKSDSKSNDTSSKTSEISQQSSFNESISTGDNFNAIIFVLPMLSAAVIIMAIRKKKSYNK